MKRAIFAACLLLLFGCPSKASPKSVFKTRTAVKVAHFLSNHVTLDVAAGASSGLATGGTFYCRQNNPDVEHCTGHYGSAAGIEVARAGLTSLMIVLSEKGRREHYREWFVPVLGATVYNTFCGVQQFRVHEHPEVREHRDQD